MSEGSFTITAVQPEQKQKRDQSFGIRWTIRVAETAEVFRTWDEVLAGSATGAIGAGPVLCQWEDEPWNFNGKEGVTHKLTACFSSNQAAAPMAVAQPAQQAQQAQMQGSMTGGTMMGTGPGPQPMTGTAAPMQTAPQPMTTADEDQQRMCRGAVAKGAFAPLYDRLPSDDPYFVFQLLKVLAEWVYSGRPPANAVAPRAAEPEPPPAPAEPGDDIPFMPSDGATDHL